jgi:NADH:ubiquinone oxidoreductase subunit 3 (subunit A)
MKNLQYYLNFELISLGLLFLISFILAVIILTLSYNVGVQNPYTDKVSAYECGFDPYEDARNAFDVRFYIIAILFIIFDLETAIFFPWSVSASLLPIKGIWCMVDFLVELAVGFAYAWFVGALETD